MSASTMTLTGDGHVHTSWSWDTGVPSSNSSMDSMCRAVQIGLPTLAFTEHLDVTTWAITAEDLPERLRPLVDANGVLNPPPLDAEGYLADVERSRHIFPELRILTGIELGQPHLDEPRVRQVIDLDSLDRVNGSLQWWREEGGQAITIASDAHTTDWLARNFYEAMAMAEHFGFHPGHNPEDFWTH